MGLRADLKQVAVQVELPVYRLCLALDDAKVSDSHRFRTYISRAVALVPPDAGPLPAPIVTARAQLTTLGLVADPPSVRSTYIKRRVVQSAVHDSVWQRVIDLAMDNDSSPANIWRPLLHFGLLITFDKLGPDKQSAFFAAHDLPFQQESVVEPAAAAT
jgi:hypothetical protein